MKGGDGKCGVTVCGKKIRVRKQLRGPASSALSDNFNHSTQKAGKYGRRINQ
jgi:hypothetical protein